MNPHDETLKRLSEIRQKMTDPVTQRIIDEARRQREDPFFQLVLRRQEEFRNQLGDQLNAIANTLAGNETVKMIKDFGPHIPTSFYSHDHYLNTLNAFRDATRGLPFDLNSVAETMRHFQNGPSLAAFETIRQMGFEGLAEQFPDFEETVAREAPTAEPKEVEQAVKKYVARPKKRGLTKEQWDVLMRYVTIFSLFATFYFGMKPAKVENNTTNVTVNYTVIIQPPCKASEIKPYWVTKDCELKAKADFKSKTTALVRKGAEVRVVYSYATWFYIELEEEGQMKYGFVPKKYLKKTERGKG